jgi:hypothetical protein
MNWREISIAEPQKTSETHPHAAAATRRTYRWPLTDGIASTLAELGAEPNFDIDLQAIEVGAGLITGK